MTVHSDITTAMIGVVAAAAFLAAAFVAVTPAHSAARCGIPAASTSSAAVACVVRGVQPPAIAP